MERRITTLTKSFILFFALLLSALIGLFVHAALPHDTQAKELANITKLPSFSLSVTYQEPRFRVLGEQVVMHPDLNPIDTMDTVYE